MRPLWALLLLTAFLLWTPTAAATPECVPEHDRDRADVLLVGRVIAKPVPLVLVVEVDRYHRGSGARYVLVDVVGPNMLRRWSRADKGVSRVMALRRSFALSLDENCFGGPPERLAGFGEMTEPTGGWDLRSSRLIQLLLLCAALAVIVLYVLKGRKGAGTTCASP